MRFALVMAWRDFRARPSRFVLYAIAIAVGVGSLTAIESFRRQLESAIDGQGRNLLGADLLLRSIRPFTPEQMKLVEQWPGSRAQLISYRTMLLEPESGLSRLVEVQAVDPGFPFYGSFTTDPPEAEALFQEQGTLLLDEVLMLQLNLAPGQEVRLGGYAVRVAGSLRQTPGEVPARALVAPRVVFPLRLAEAERFQRPGMMARFEWYIAHDDTPSAHRALNPLAGEARRLGLDVETVAGRREQLLGRTDRMGRYLGIMGFTSLMIGCLGVAGAVHFFVNAKRTAVAQLRCIGASLYQAGGLFVVQLIGLALLGATLGVGLGLGFGRVIPMVLAPFLPVPVGSGFRGDAAAEAWLIGVLFTVLSGLFPITRLRHISPLRSLRVELVPSTRRVDAAGILAVVLLVSVLLGFATRQLGSVKMAAIYLSGVLMVLGLLALTGFAMRGCGRRMVRPQWSYTMRLAVGGLYRPQNQTALLVMSLGLGVFLITLVDVMERHLISDVESMDRERPNLAMIDIQTDQQDELLALLQSFGPQSVYPEPMITMRLASIRGVAVDQIEQEPGNTRPNWALKREFRTTYRQHQKPEIETVIAGEWVGDAHDSSPFPVSLEQGIAEALGVEVGDELAFDIHGEIFEVRVANIREVDWKSMQPNFFVIFPVGPIDHAPQSILMFSQLEDVANRAAFQSEVARRFPNITTIDIALVMNTVGVMLGQLAVAVRSIAWMTLLAGLFVLVAILRAGRQTRLREAVLLRTLGASESVIVRYQAMEFFLLALGAVISGVLLAGLASFLVVQYILKLPFDPDWQSPWPMMALLLFLVTLMGWLNGRAATRRSPAVAWRTLSVSSS